MRPVQPVEPGYYRIDSRRASFGELRRWGNGGYGSALISYLLRHRLTHFSYEQWLPAFWDDLTVSRDKLSPPCLECIDARAARLLPLGFRVVEHQRAPLLLATQPVDNGALYLLHESGHHFAVVWAVKTKHESSADHIAGSTSIGMACELGKTLLVKDSDIDFDSPSPCEIVALREAPVEALWRRAQRERARLERKGYKILSIRTVDELARLHDEHERWVTHQRVNERRVLVKMTDAEIQTARRAWGLPDDTVG
jgi:hypothetical protein